MTIHIKFHVSLFEVYVNLFLLLLFFIYLFIYLFHVELRNIFFIKIINATFNLFFLLILLLNKQPLEALLRISAMLFQGEVSIGISFSVDLQTFGLRLY